MKKGQKGHKGEKTADIIDFLVFTQLFSCLTSARYSGITYTATQSIDENHNTMGIYSCRNNRKLLNLFYGEILNLRIRGDRDDNKGY